MLYSLTTKKNSTEDITEGIYDRDTRPYLGFLVNGFSGPVNIARAGVNRLSEAGILEAYSKEPFYFRILLIFLRNVSESIKMIIDRRIRYIILNESEYEQIFKKPSV